MLRAVLVGLLSVSALACKSTEESAKVQPGVAAGKVIEVRGTVTVRREAAARPLAVGETIAGDDIVETGADGSVVIELSHNLARWELGANRTSKVSESVAWSLPKKTGEAANVEQTSAAAGRHAERSAAETSVSASAEPERESAPAAESAAAPTPAAAPPAPARAAAAPADEAPPPPPPAPARRSFERREASADADGAAEHDEVRGDSRGAIGALGKGGGTATGQGAGAGSGRLAAKSGAGAPPEPPAESPSDIVLRHERTIKACLTKDMPAVSLRISVGEDGKPTVVVKGKTEVPAAVKRCVTNAVKKLKFPAQAATVTIEIMR